ncbi:hypothetical protein, partial [Sinorhizobium saheli]|uniref:hypothetical protein n=1 Tax=Sinorhizobium saheli TaxID=36856 RepID=UPI001AEEBE16
NQWHDPGYLKPPGLARKTAIHRTKSIACCLWMETSLVLQLRITSHFSVCDCRFELVLSAPSGPLEDERD